MLHQEEEGQLKQVEAAQRLGLSVRHLRRWQRRGEAEGDRGLMPGRRGMLSNRKMAPEKQARILTRVGARYGDFGPTLAQEKLGGEGLEVSREPLRQWRMAAGLGKAGRQRVSAVDVWRERRAAFGELVMRDSSPYRWLEERGPELHLIAMIDDATSRIWGRFAEHDTTAENLRTLEGWLRRHGRPLALYTDRDSIFQAAGRPNLDEELAGQPAGTQFGRALQQLGIEWIAARSPQAKGRIENLCGTLQDRLVKEMRLAKVQTVEEANRFFQEDFVPFWEQRFARPPRQAEDAHRRLEREHRLEQMLSLREPCRGASDYPGRWPGRTWAIPRAEVRAGLRGARVEVEQRWDGSLWARFQAAYLMLRPGPAATGFPTSPSGLGPPGLAEKPKTTKTKSTYIPPPNHPWRRTFLFGRKPDISILR